MDLKYVLDNYSKFIFLISSGGITVDTRTFTDAPYFDAENNLLTISNVIENKKVTLSGLETKITILGLR